MAPKPIICPTILGPNTKMRPLLVTKTKYKQSLKDHMWQAHLTMPQIWKTGITVRSNRDPPVNWYHSFYTHYESKQTVCQNQNTGVRTIMNPSSLPKMSQERVTFFPKHESQCIAMHNVISHNHHRYTQSWNPNRNLLERSNQNSQVATRSENHLTKTTNWLERQAN